MHNKMGIGDTGVNFLDSIDRQNISRGWTGKFIGAVAGADSDCEGIHTCFRREITCPQIINFTVVTISHDRLHPG